MKRIMMFIAVFVLMMFSVVGLCAQTFSEGFETAVPPTGWTGVGATQSTTQVHGGTYSAYYINSGDYLITPKLANPGAMTWYVYKGGTGNARTLVETSPDGTTGWTERYRGGNDQGGSWKTHTYTFAVTNVYIRFSFVQGGGTALYLDDISIDPASYNLYYQSKTSGDWASASTWEYSTDNITWYAATSAPTASTALTITILNTHTVSVAANVTADQVVVNSGGTLQVNSGYTLNLANGTGDDLTVNGNLTVIGAVTYDTGATMAAGSGSTIKFAGTTGGQTTGTGFPSSVYNLIIDNPNGVTLSGNLTITTQLTMTSGAWSLGTNTISYAGGSSLLYNGTSAQTVGDEWPATMSVNITNDNTHSNGLTLNGNKTYNTGTFTNNTILDVGSYAISGNGTVINNDTIISDTSSPVTTSTFSQTAGSTIDYTSDVTLPSPFTYQNLVLSSSSTQFNLGGNINVNETFSTQNGASLDLDGYRMIFPFKYVSVGGDQVITAFTPETYVEGPGYMDAVQRKWTFAGAGSGSVDMYLHWDNNQDDGADFTNGTKIWNYDGSQWITVATLASQQPDADPDNASRSMISFSSSLVAKANVSGQYAVSGYDATLPVELSSFTATISATNYVQLQWVTQSETNVSGYRLYRGSDLDLSTAVMLNAFIEATNTSQMQVYVYWDEEVWESGTYYYWLQNLDFDGGSAFHGPISITVNLNDSGSPVIPVIQGISSIYPNPFNPNTAVRLGIVRPGNVKVAVYNTRGQMVRELFEGFRDQGTHTLQWDGTDANGSALPSGMYVIRMTSGTQVYQRKAILMK